MKLFVVRHAKAEERNAQRCPDDSLRALTKGGIEKFRRLAKRVGRIVQAPEVVLSSGYVRAWETARILEEAAGWPAPTRLAALECDARDALDAVASALVERSESSLAIVGHEPFLSELIAHLIGGDPASIVMDKGAVAILELDHSLTGGSLCALVTPSWTGARRSKR